MNLDSGRITSTVALIALTVWVGGLIVMGAVVAPVVFGSLPYNLAADTMTVAFKRYDKIALVAAAVVLATEAARAGARGRPRASDLVRVGVTVALVGLAAMEGLWITPTIASLHAAGAVRGVGEAGESLASAHSLAEQVGKGQAVLAIALIALHLFTVARPPREADEEQPAEA